MNNLFIALLLSTLVLAYWEHYIAAPRRKAEGLALQQQAQHVAAAPSAVDAAPLKSRAELLALSPRVPIISTHLHGSLALRGLRMDDLHLARYRETLDPASPEVTLFSPGGEVPAYFAEFGWLPASDTSVTVPDANSLWQADAPSLTPEHPLTLRWTNLQGLVFLTRLTLDEKYLFTVTQTVQNAKGEPVALRHYAYVNRVFDSKKVTPGLSHEGPFGVVDGTLQETDYKKLIQEKEEAIEAHSGWLGLSDKYWMAAIIPRLPAPEPAPEGVDPGTQPPAFTGKFAYYESKGREHAQVDYTSPASLETTLYFFAGAKELSVLDQYSSLYHIPLLDRAVDFGRLYFLSEPIFWLLTYFHAVIGNFGIAILLLTVLVKALMYPLASKSFRAMNQMKRLQPKMTELRERFKDDKLRMNQEVMELYKRERVNPAAGCLPIFIQLPVFYALYRVLYVTIEMRHAPFYGWVHDLSAPDPSNLFTLFGLAPWHVPPFLHLGIWPLVMCATMLIQQRQTPAPPDPTQAKMMKILPFFFLFLFTGAPAGMVIYWSWSNTLTILQQWMIKKRHGD